MEPIIEIKNLYKSFGTVKAVQDVSFRVQKGELFAFLGVNGAGKSTTISILCGQLSRDGGEVFVDGRSLDSDLRLIRRKLGVVFQNSVLDAPLSVRDNLESRAALYGITGVAFEKRLQELIELLDFGYYLKRPVGKLSGGERRRVDIARALLHKPEILILDEPTAGLDPAGREEILSYIDGYRKAKNATIMMVSHSMNDVARMTDRLIVMNHAHLAMEGTPMEVFRHAQDLVDMGLDIPDITHVFLKLKQLGLPVEPVYTTEQAVAALMKLRGGNAHA